MGKIGDICESRKEIIFEWKIKDFLLLSHEVNKRYESPEFHLSGVSWEIWIYPNGHRENASEGWVSLFVCRKFSDFPVTVDYSLSLKGVGIKTESLDIAKSIVFDKTNNTWGSAKCISRSELIERKSELLPSDALTVICTLKNKESSDGDENEDPKKTDRNTQTEKDTGVWKLQQYLREILLNGNVSDVVLKVDDQEFKTHRCILARSPVFLAMMTHETKEKNTGVVEIPDVDPNTFSDFLTYLYTGNEESITSQNVIELYTAADKYQVDELKKVCVDYMLKNMSVDNFCDALALSLRHKEKDLTDACSEFFSKNSLAIVLTSKWLTFLSENVVAGNELYVKHLQICK